MTVPSGTESQGQGNDTGQPDIQPPVQQDPPGDDGKRPPYWDELQSLPSSVHQLVEPVFKQWEQKVNQQFEQRAQQLNRYKPYEEIISQYDPEAVQMAVQFAHALQSNPEKVLQDLAQSMGYDFDDEDLEGLDPDDPSSEKLQMLEQGMSQLIETIEGDRQSQQEQAEEQEIYGFLQSVSEQNAQQYGELDTRAYKMILTAAASDGDLEGAVQWYYDEVAKPVGVNNTPNDTPQVLGAGGSLPSNNQDLTKLDKRKTEELVVSMLNAAKQNQ